MQNFAREENITIAYFMKDNDFPWIFQQKERRMQMTKQVEKLIGKLGNARDQFDIWNEDGYIIAKYLPYDLEFVYVPEGRYNKGLSIKERRQAKEINEYVSFQNNEMEYEEGIIVRNMLVMRTPLLNGFVDQFIPHKFPIGEDKFAAYLMKNDIDQICNKLGLRLPTEIESEYYIRAGSSDLFAFGSKLLEEEELDSWLSLDFSNLQSLKCNQFGLYGIYTGEWCADKYRMNNDSEYEDSFVVKEGGAYFWPWEDNNEWIWCMSAMRMSSDGLVNGECGARLIFDI